MSARAFLCIFTLTMSGAVLASVTKLVQKVDSAVVVLKTQGRSVDVSGNRIKEVAAEGLGTGVLVDREGHVVTAAHVVQTADSVVAEFVDGTEVSATVVSSDPSLDLALLKLDSIPASATTVKLGDSAKLQVGDDVVVIGSPFGLSHSVSTGIVSGRHSPGAKDGSLGGLTAEIIQTDAAINKGNSGGPMFNAKGEVVGIVSFILSQSGGFEGIGFAISSNTAKQALFVNPMFWSGFEGIVVQGELADALNLGYEAGMLVQKVATGSLAASLGLKPGKVPVTIQGRDILLGGDIIVSVEGVNVRPDKVGEIRQKMKQLSPNDRLKIEVKRAGRLIVLQAVLPPNQ
ncbi:MAG: S1C family serine protease [Pseudomonadales bacterium]